MGAEPNANSRATVPSFINIADEITIAADLVGAICMAALSLGRDERDAIARVSSIATDHLVNATRMIEALMEGADE